MNIKFSLPTIAIAAFLVLSHSAIASAEVYKTGKDQVVVTGLTAKQKYPIKAVNAKNKPAKRQDVTANTCGEALVDGAGKYKSLVVGTETIDPATLSTKEHPRCNGNKKTATTPKKKGAVKSTTATTTVTPSTTVPAAVPSVAPVTK
jgi:pyruvate kinase